jgi:cytochrome c-type biogenesis protein
MTVVERANYSILGTAFQTILTDIRVMQQCIGGIILIAFGLHLLGLLRIPGVERDYLKMKFGKKPVGHIGAFVVGMGFGAGWTPCIGAILASILDLLRN